MVFWYSSDSEIALMHSIVVLVRHGVSSSYRKGEQAVPGPSLSREGKRQARMTAQYLREYAYHAIFTSTMRRAQETAEEINAFHRKRIRVVPEFAEYDDAIFEECGQDFEEDETCSFLARRVRASQRAFQKILAAHEGKRMLIVAHGNVLRGIVGLLLGFPVRRIPDFNFFPCSITSFSLTGGTVTGIYHVNSVDHYRGTVGFRDRFDKGIV